MASFDMIWKINKLVSVLVWHTSAIESFTVDYFPIIVHSQSYNKDNAGEVVAEMHSGPFGGYSVADVYSEVDEGN